MQVHVDGAPHELLTADMRDRLMHATSAAERAASELHALQMELLERRALRPDSDQEAYKAETSIIRLRRRVTIAEEQLEATRLSVCSMHVMYHARVACTRSMHDRVRVLRT